MSAAITTAETNVSFWADRSTAAPVAMACSCAVPEADLFAFFWVKDALECSCIPLRKWTGSSPPSSVSRFSEAACSTASASCCKPRMSFASPSLYMAGLTIGLRDKSSSASSLFATSACAMELAASFSILVPLKLSAVSDWLNFTTPASSRTAPLSSGLSFMLSVFMLSSTSNANTRK